MEYRDFLIYLNTLGINNKEVLKIENIIKLNKYNTNDFFNKKFLNTLQKFISKKTFEKLSLCENDLVKRVEDYCDKNNISIHTYLDPLYPANLKLIENSPRIIYSKGQIKEKEEIGISIVGSRKHSEYGKAVVNYIIDNLKEYNPTIISGLAYGIDSLSHKRSINNKIRTLAVLGCGVDVIYPKSNEYLYNSILYENGAILSEYPPKTSPLPFRFPLRNRIISGLGDIVIVVEAMERSGSLITARLAAEQGKEIFAVPGNINSIYSKGTNLLIRDGARIFTSMDDLISCLPFENINKETTFDESELGNDELKVLDQIRSGVNDINLIAINLKEDISFINSIVTILELKNIVNSTGYKVNIKI